MKVKKPAEEVEVCDYCQRGGYLQTCIVCGASYCLTCDATVCGSGISPDVCQPCARRPDVLRVCDKWGADILAVARKRDGALKRLRKKVLADRRAKEVPE